MLTGMPPSGNGPIGTRLPQDQPTEASAGGAQRWRHHSRQRLSPAPRALRDAANLLNCSQACHCALIDAGRASASFGLQITDLAAYAGQP